MLSFAPCFNRYLFPLRQKSQWVYIFLILFYFRKFLHVLKIFDPNVFYFFPFCTVNFCEASTYTYNNSEGDIKNLTFERIIVGKYGSSNEKCEPHTANGMFLSFYFRFTKANIRFVKDVRSLEQKMRALCLKPEQQSSSSRSTNLSTQLPTSSAYDLMYTSQIRVCLELNWELVKVANELVFDRKNITFYHGQLSLTLSMNCGWLLTSLKLEKQNTAFGFLTEETWKARSTPAAYTSSQWPFRVTVARQFHLPFLVLSWWIKCFLQDMVKSLSDGLVLMSAPPIWEPFLQF